MSDVHKTAKENKTRMVERQKYKKRRKPETLTFSMKNWGFSVWKFLAITGFLLKSL